MHAKSTILCTFLLITLICGDRSDDDDSYSYHKFRGPVSGEVRPVTVHGNALDYVAKPDYGYAYGVEDSKTGNAQKHEETRLGDAVKGEYRVWQPDGLIRIVKYTADGESGFQATVTYEKA